MKFKIIISYVFLLIIPLVSQVNEWQIKPNEPLGSFMVNQPGFNGQSIVKPEFAPFDQSKHLTLSSATEDLIIDGELDEEVWAKTEPLQEFIDKNTYDLARDQTEIKIIFDEKHIFISAVCNEPYIANMRNESRTHDDPVMLDDHLGIYLTPLKRLGEKHFYEGYYYFIAINPLGIVFDAFYNPWHGGIFYPNWNPQIEVQIKHMADKWIVEMSVAFEGLEYYVPAGREYVVNFTRTQFNHRGQLDSFAKSGVLVKSTYKSMVSWRIPFYDSRFIPLSEYWPDSLEFIRPDLSLQKVVRNQTGIIDWSKAVVIEDLLMHDSGQLPSGRTKVNITYDDDSLYVRYVCCDSLMDELTAKNKEHDWPGWDEWGTYRSPEKYRVEDDAIGMYIAPNFDERGQYHRPYYLIMVNVDGVVYDACFDQFGIFYKTWESNLRAKIIKESHCWIAELCIPFSSFTIDPDKSDDWGFNAFRRRPAKSNTGTVHVKDWCKGQRKGQMDVLYKGGYEISCWSPTYGHLRNPMRMGIMRGLELDQVSQVKAHISQQLQALENRIKTLQNSGQCTLTVNKLQDEFFLLKNQLDILSKVNLKKVYKSFYSLKSQVKTWSDWIFAERIQQVSLTDRRLTDVHFVDKNNGWVVGSGGMILYTSDGGETWRVQDSGTDYELEGIYFADKFNGWAVGGNIRPPRGENFIDRDVGAMGIILHTQDGGKTWLPQLMGDGRWLYDVTFVDDQVGWVVGAFGLVMKTEDGGETWKVQSTGSLKWLNKVCFVDRHYGWIACEDEEVLMTKDGGDLWQKVQTPLHKDTNNWPGVLNAIFFADRKLGWAVGRGGNVFQSRDGGTSWTLQQIPYKSPIKELVEFQDVYFVNETSGWAISCLGDVVFRTKDSGRTWQVGHTGNRNWLHAIYFVDERTGWIVGERGTILRSDDGGRSWQIQCSDGDQLDILVLHAHSDDELPIAYLTTYYADQGYKIGYIRYTINDLSTYRLGELRTQEYRATSAYLGGVVNRTMYQCINAGREGFPMPYMYQEWGGWSPSERWMVAAIRALRPKVIITQETAFDKVSHSVGGYMVVNAIKTAADKEKYTNFEEIGLHKWNTPKVYLMVWPRLFENSYNPWPATLKMDKVITRQSPRLGKTYEYIGIHAFTYCQSQGGYKGHQQTIDAVPSALHLLFSKVVTKKENDLFTGLKQD